MGLKLYVDGALVATKSAPAHSFANQPAYFSYVL
jgi:hypothetical protein